MNSYAKIQKLQNHDIVLKSNILQTVHQNLPNFDIKAL